MTQVTNSETSPFIYVGIGVGIYDHKEFGSLKCAISEVKQIGKALAKDDCQMNIITNPQEIGAVTVNDGCKVYIVEDPEEVFSFQLEQLLPKDALREGGYLVILWSGHGETSASGLRLIARNSKPRSKAHITATDLAEVAAHTGANQILLILDTCYSGGGVLPATAVVDQIQQAMPPKSDDIGFSVIASSIDYEQAQDCVFGIRFQKILSRGPDDAKLKHRWSPFNEDVFIGDVYEALRQEWDTSNKPKSLVLGGQFRLPNPLHRSVSPVQMDTYLRGAARGTEPDEDGFYFTGRVAQLNRIVAWMRDGKPGVFAVTGPPGIGKSAVVGRIVSLSNPDERSLLLEQGCLEHADPGEGSVNAHVYARRYNTEQLFSAIDKQLVHNGFLSQAPNQSRTRGELLDAIQNTEKYPVIVIDGLNEAGAESEAWRIAEDVGRSLSQVSLVLVGTQDLPPLNGPVSLLRTLGATNEINLGEPAIQKEAASDLHQYIKKRLSDVVAPAMDLSKVADTVLALSRNKSTGAFLLARFLTTQLRSAPVDTSRPNWQNALMDSIKEQTERLITRVPPLMSRAGVKMPHAARDLLEALAWAKGAGVPDDIWPIIATAISPSGTAYERYDAYELLPHIRHYLIEDGLGGRAVYRLVHQSISDDIKHIAATTCNPTDSNNLAARVAWALVNYYQTLLTANDLPKRRAYLWRYLWQHCADAGEQGIEAFRLLVKSNKKTFASQLARALSALSRSHERCGRWWEAFKANDEAVEIYRELLESDSTALIDLAETLTNLGLNELELGQPKKGLDAAKEAVDLLRTMDTANPAIGFQFAWALTVCGLGYAQNGQLQETVGSAEEAVLFLRQLNSDNPAFGPLLAYAQAVLSLGYTQSGQPTEGLDAAKEAVDLFRTMDTAKPAVGAPFALALTVCGLGHIQTGQPTEGLDAAKEAVDLLRTMDTANPAIGFQLASALTVCGLGHIQTGQPTEGLDAAKEAVDLLRTMDTANPAIGFQLASALTVCGLGHIQTGQPTEGLDAAKEAVDLLRTMDTANPAIGAPFALALTVCGLGHIQTGQPTEGLDAAKEAVDLYKTMDTANPAIGAPFALALTVCGLGHIQTGQPTEGLDAAKEAVDLLRTMDTANPAIGFQLASALTVCGLGHIQTGQPTEGLDAAKEAVDLLRTMDTANPAIGAPFALALTVCGLGHIQTEQPTEGLDAAKEAVDLYKTMDTANPAIGAPFALALTVCGLGHIQTGQPTEGLDAAKEAVDLYKTMDTANPAIGAPFAWALTVSGLGYAQNGQPQRAIENTDEAIRIYQNISNSNPHLLQALAYALLLLNGYYRDLDRAEIDAYWEAVINSLQQSGDKVFLLLTRSYGRDPGDISAVDDLIQAKSYLTDEDREMTAELHQACRSIRARDPIAFDAAWVERSGEHVPQWLSQEETYLEILWQWINTKPLELQRDFLSKHIGQLPPESTSVALDEIALTLTNQSAIEYFRDLLEHARSVGVEESYRPLLANSFLNNWMSSDMAATRTMLLERREELLGNDVKEQLSSRLADYPEDPTLIFHSRLLDLARTDQEYLLFQSIEEPAQTPALLLDLARSGDVDALDAMATAIIIYNLQETDAQRALPLFYKAIALALGKQPDKAFEVLIEARRLDPTQLSTWLTCLSELAADHHEELIPLSQGLIAPLPPEATDA